MTWRAGSVSLWDSGSPVPPGDSPVSGREVGELSSSSVLTLSSYHEVWTDS